MVYRELTGKYCAECRGEAVFGPDFSRQDNGLHRKFPATNNREMNPGDQGINSA
jgi:hypothetical protein